MQRVEHDLTAEQWSALKSAWGGCAYCGASDRPLQRDCVRALSRCGRYTLDNIAPACGPCNASKCNDEVTGWLRRKRLDEGAFLRRHLEVRALLARRFPAEPVAPDTGATRDAGDAVEVVEAMDREEPVAGITRSAAARP